jgi:hypothetical protein
MSDDLLARIDALRREIAASQAAAPWWRRLRWRLAAWWHREDAP